MSLASARGLHEASRPAERCRGVSFALGEQEFCFRFLSRFGLPFPVLVTVAPVSRCGVWCLGVSPNELILRAAVVRRVPVYLSVEKANGLPKLVVVGSNPIARSKPHAVPIRQNPLLLPFLFLKVLPADEIDLTRCQSSPSVQPVQIFSGRFSFDTHDRSPALMWHSHHSVFAHLSLRHPE